MASLEEKVEDFYKDLLKNLGIRIYSKTESIRGDIDEALSEANSKSGGSGKNYPDIKFILQNSFRETIPVFVEAKGGKRKLEKLDKDGFIELVVKRNGQDSYRSIQNYAVNGALHYGLAALEKETIDEVIIIGINGTETDSCGNIYHPEFKAYYVSKANNKVPKLIDLDEEWVSFKENNIDDFFIYLRSLNLTEEEIRANQEKAENDLDEKIHSIHQKIYDDERLKNPLSTNDKLYLFTGLIMAGLKIHNIHSFSIKDLHSDNNESSNDGTAIMERIKVFLKEKSSYTQKNDMIIDTLSSVFNQKVLWEPHNGISILKELFQEVQSNIIPILESKWHLDFAGKILNHLSDWVKIDNDSDNDVVLTPKYITNFMVRLTRTNMNSYVWDRAMGTGGFLLSALDIMVLDANNNITDNEELKLKIQKIKAEQLMGVEILKNVYILAVLNMILMGDGNSRILNEDSHKDLPEYHDFPADVFLLNPPYSAPGKGFNFVEEGLEDMEKGYAAVIIQESAGSGKGLPYTKRILKNNTLLASIHMPMDLFAGRASVQSAIFLFEAGKPHDVTNEVTFIDMSNDGYARKNRKKSSQKINLRDVDDAQGRYDEVVAKLTGKKAKTNYYTEENGLLIKDTISLEGNDWTYQQHCVIDNCPTEDDFKKVVSDYLSFRVSQILKEGVR